MSQTIEQHNSWTHQSFGLFEIGAVTRGPAPSSKKNYKFNEVRPTVWKWRCHPARPRDALPSQMAHFCVPYRCRKRRHKAPCCVGRDWQPKYRKSSVATFLLFFPTAWFSINVARQSSFLCVCVCVWQNGTAYQNLLLQFRVGMLVVAYTRLNVKGRPNCDDGKTRARNRGSPKSNKVRTEN